MTQMTDRKALQRSQQIIHSLIEGVDPFTKELLTPGTVLQNSEVLRALLVADSTLQRECERAERRQYFPKNVGGRWSKEDLATLVSGYENGEPIPKLAEKLGRTIRGIEHRLLQLGLISEKELTSVQEQRLFMRNSAGRDVPGAGRKRRGARSAKRST